MIVARSVTDRWVRLIRHQNQPVTICALGLPLSVFLAPAAGQTLARSDARGASTGPARQSRSEKLILSHDVFDGVRQLPVGRPSERQHERLEHPWHWLAHRGFASAWAVSGNRRVIDPLPAAGKHGCPPRRASRVASQPGDDSRTTHTQLAAPSGR